MFIQVSVEYQLNSENVALDRVLLNAISQSHITLQINAHIQ